MSSMLGGLLLYNYSHTRALTFIIHTGTRARWTFAQLNRELASLVRKADMQPRDIGKILQSTDSLGGQVLDGAAKVKKDNEIRVNTQTESSEESEIDKEEIAMGREREENQPHIQPLEEKK